MNAKRISEALIVSLVIHGIIMLIASVSYITQTEQFKRAVSVEILQSKAPPISQVRKPVIKPVVQSPVVTNGLADQAVQSPIVVVDKPVIKPMIESSAVTETDLSNAKAGVFNTSTVERSRLVRSCGGILGRRGALGTSDGLGTNARYYVLITVKNSKHYSYFFCVSCSIEITTPFPQKHTTPMAYLNPTASPK